MALEAERGGSLFLLGQGGRLRRRLTPALCAIERVLRVIKATLRWIAAPFHVWLCLGVTVAALIISLRPNTPEPVIRLTGLVLQLLGVLTVAWGISETRALFGRPSIRSKISAWLSAAPFLKPHHGSATGRASVGGIRVKARGHATHGAGESPTTESRLQALEKNIEVVHQRITGLAQEYDQELSHLSTSLREEQASRVQQVTSVHTRLEEFGTGGVHISAIGAAWLFVGLVLSTAGPELARLVNNA